MFAITERTDTGLYDVPLYMSVFVGFWDGEYMLGNFHMCGIMFVYR